MDKNYKLLSWDIPHLGIKISLGDQFVVDGNTQTLTQLMYADDSAGIYKVYPHLDDNFHMLYRFVKDIEEGIITKVPITPTKNVRPYEFKEG
jgi:hypothetical protein